jgi:hypothetical protein
MLMQPACTFQVGSHVSRVLRVLIQRGIQAASGMDLVQAVLKSVRSIFAPFRRPVWRHGSHS